MKNKLNTLKELFCTFFKIGAFTFGGGYAMISIIQKEAVENKKWVSDEDILDVVAIAESTPGPIAINSSTFIGYKVMGFWGAFFATLGTVLPSFIIISTIAYFLGQFNEYRVVKFAFNGIRAGVFVLIILLEFEVGSYVTVLKHVLKLSIIIETEDDLHTLGIMMITLCKLCLACPFPLQDLTVRDGLGSFMLLVVRMLVIS